MVKTTTHSHTETQKKCLWIRDSSCKCLATWYHVCYQVGGMCGTEIVQQKHCFAIQPVDYTWARGMGYSVYLLYSFRFLILYWDMHIIMQCRYHSVDSFSSPPL